MKILIFDTETTGLFPGNICQLSYIIKDGDAVQGRNYYFKVNYVEPGALKIHGLSVDKLDRLSDGKRFGDHIEAIQTDFNGSERWIAHNWDFDIRFLSSEFMESRKNIRRNKGFCTMKYFTPICRLTGKNAKYKYPSLEELVRFFRIGEKEIEQSSRQIFGQQASGFHNAMFDTAATYLCYCKALEQGLIKE